MLFIQACNLPLKNSKYVDFEFACLGTTKDMTTDSCYTDLEYYLKTDFKDDSILIKTSDLNTKTGLRTGSFEFYKLKMPYSLRVSLNTLYSTNMELNNGFVKKHNRKANCGPSLLISYKDSTDRLKLFTFYVSNANDEFDIVFKEAHKIIFDSNKHGYIKIKPFDTQSLVRKYNQLDSVDKLVLPPPVSSTTKFVPPIK